MVTKRINLSITSVDPPSSRKIIHESDDGKVVEKSPTSNIDSTKKPERR